MWIFTWMLIAAFMFFGFLFFSMMSIGALAGLIINLALLPIRILLFVIKSIFGVF